LIGLIAGLGTPELLLSFHGKTIPSFCTSAITALKARRNDAVDYKSKSRMDAEHLVFPPRAPRWASLSRRQIGGACYAGFCGRNSFGSGMPGRSDFPNPRPKAPDPDHRLHGHNGPLRPGNPGFPAQLRSFLSARNVPHQSFFAASMTSKGAAAMVEQLSLLAGKPYPELRAGSDLRQQCLVRLYIHKPGKVRSNMSRRPDRDSFAAGRSGRCATASFATSTSSRVA